MFQSLINLPRIVGTHMKKQSDCMLEHFVVCILKTWLTESVEIVITSANPVWVSLPDYKQETGSLRKEMVSPFVSLRYLPLSSHLPAMEKSALCVCVFTDRCQGNGDWVYVCSPQWEGGLLLMFLSSKSGVNHTSWKSWLERVGTLSPSECVLICSDKPTTVWAVSQKEAQHRKMQLKSRQKGNIFQSTDYQAKISETEMLKQAKICGKSADPPAFGIIKD